MKMSRRTRGKSLAGLLLVLAASASLRAAEPTAGVVRIRSGNSITRTSLATPATPAGAAVTPIPESTDGGAPLADGAVVGPGPGLVGDPLNPYANYGIGRAYYRSNGPNCGYTYFGVTPRCCNGRLDCYLGQQELCFRARNRHTSASLGAHLRCALLPLAPLTYWDAGARCDVIAQNPGYVDPRGQQTFAAQGYGVPMAVPLAPVVRDQYNYGWGLPSSRLEPVSYPPYR
jgi:hypothetical protein